MKIYRKIMVSDRLPKESGYYLTNSGIRYFIESFKNWDITPQYWLEEIELPTQEEIEIDCLELPYSDDMSPNDLSIQGANYILNKIK